MNRGREYGTPFAATATASGNATASVSQVAGANKLYVTDVSGSSDLAGATLQVKDGSTVIWQDRISNTCAMVYQFSMPLVVAGTLTVVVTGTSYGAANVTGYSL